jgi:hypothetical protein
MASDSISRSCLKYYKRKSLIDFYDFYNGLNSLPAAICVAKNMACLSSLLFCVGIIDHGGTSQGGHHRNNRYLLNHLHSQDLLKIMFEEQRK